MPFSILRRCALGARHLRLPSVGRPAASSASNAAPPPTTPAAYHQLLTAIRATFAGDGAALASCTAQARAAFRANAGAGPDEVPPLLAQAADAAEFLGSHVLQAKLNGGSGRYEMKLPGGGDAPGEATVTGAAAAAAGAAPGAPKEGECCGGRCRGCGE